MLQISKKTTIFIHGGPVDLRNGFEGLSFFAQQSFGKLVQEGLYVFLNRRRTRAKVLHWNGENLSLWYTHSKEGVFSPRHLKRMVINKNDFLNLLKGNPSKRLLCYKTPK